MKSKMPRNVRIAEEATEWLLRFEDPDVDPEDPYPDPVERQRHFLAWVRQSPQHMRAFLELYETYYKVGQLAPQLRIDIEDLLAQRTAEIVPLFAEENTVGSAQAATVEEEPATPQCSKIDRRWAYGVGVAAFVAVGTGLLMHSLGAEAYTTAVGEQRTCQLEDGSIVYLNTDSSVEVEYTVHERNLRLVRGEALFAVQKDQDRPFIVQTDDIGIRAEGTQFNVRQRGHATDISVIQGGVQITPATKSSVVRHTPRAGAHVAGATEITEGQEVRVSHGRLVTLPPRDIGESISWRNGKLIFSNRPLWEVAEEFNRYNRHQIKVEGEAARQIEMSGRFDVDQPQDLILYLNRFVNDETPLSVLPRGDDWVIRAR
jgi:ferric-dicitrate binding protein FerR (iron transport regulator)